MCVTNIIHKDLSHSIACNRLNRREHCVRVEDPIFPPKLILSQSCVFCLIASAKVLSHTSYALLCCYFTCLNGSTWATSKDICNILICCVESTSHSGNRWARPIEFWCDIRFFCKGWTYFSPVPSHFWVRDSFIGGKILIFCERIIIRIPVFVPCDNYPSTVINFIEWWKACIKVRYDPF